MADIVQSATFRTWLKGLRDARGKAAILVRIERLAAGNPGDVRPAGQGISELRVNFGPGYRIYYKAVGSVVILLLNGGDKSTQAADIARAAFIAAEWE